MRACSNRTSKSLILGLVHLDSEDNTLIPAVLVYVPQSQRTSSY